MKVLKFEAWAKLNQDLLDEFKASTEECGECDGIGETKCSECGNTSECGYCEGTGYVSIHSGPAEDPEIRFQDEWKNRIERELALLGKTVDEVELVDAL